MNRNKYSISRLKRLSAMLKENRYPNFPRFLAEMKKTDLAGAYKLSARTFLRDIAFLKSEYGAPIRYDYTQKGYYLTVPDWSIDIPYLEDNEMQAAVIGARLAENIMPEPVKRTVRDAVDSLLSVNEKGMDENATLLSLIAMGSRVSIRPEVFQPLFESWQTHRCVKIVYDSVTGRQSTHLIEPQVLAFYEGNWYIKGFSLIRDGRKIPANERRANVFALHRIVSVEKTDTVRPAGGFPQADGIAQPVRVDFLNPADHVKKPHPAGNSVCLEAWGNSETDGFFRPGRICHDQVCGQRIQIPVSAKHLA